MSPREAAIQAAFDLWFEAKPTWTSLEDRHAALTALEAELERVDRDHPKETTDG